MSENKQSTCSCSVNDYNFNEDDCLPFPTQSNYFATDGEFVYDENENKTGKDLELRCIEASNPTEATKYILKYKAISNNRYINNSIGSIYFGKETYDRLKGIIDKTNTK